ncbi:hypothetical protein AB3Y40_06875 [Yoonia sp. R2331]|uniref:hypothetical protein n=1 Tax=Yoonia sp. R2331 TaxID=3237238 RepID=UPI0034E3F532
MQLGISMGLTQARATAVSAGVTVTTDTGIPLFTGQQTGDELVLTDQPYAGTYTIPDVSGGPVYLKAPVITTNTGQGETQTATPGLVAYDNSLGTVTISGIWQADAVDISGETGLTYTIGVDDVDLRYRETASQPSLTAANSNSNVVAIPAASFAPTDLGSKLKLWLDFTDTSTLYQTTDTSTPADTAADPVARVDDKSGNGNHFTRSTSSPLPEVSANGNVVFVADEYLKGQTNDTWHQAVTDGTYCASIKTDDQDGFMLLNSRLTSSWFGICQNSTSTALDANSGTVTYRKNGAAITPSTRNDMRLEYATDTTLVATAQGLDLSGWPNDAWLGAYASNGSLSFAGEMNEVVIADGLTTAERDSLETYMARHNA